MDLAVTVPTASVGDCFAQSRGAELAGVAGLVSDGKRCTSPRSSAALSPDARWRAWRRSLQGRPRVPLPRPCSGAVSGLAHGERVASQPRPSRRARRSPRARSGGGRADSDARPRSRSWSSYRDRPRRPEPPRDLVIEVGAARDGRTDHGGVTDGGPCVRPSCRSGIAPSITRARAAVTVRPLTFTAKPPDLPRDPFDPWSFATP